jgi:hypothetical protein
MRYDLEPVEPPALPVAPPDYVQGERDKYSNVLRLYFTRISSFIRNLIGRVGGRFLDFPNGAFSDDRDYSVNSSSVDAPLRFDTTIYSNEVELITDTVSFSAAVDDGAGGVGNVLTTGFFLGTLYPGMEVTATGLAAGTYITGVVSSTSYRLSSTALLTTRDMTATGKSKIKVNYAGRYNFQFSIQFANLDNAAHTISVWWRQNGTNVTDSNSEFGIPVRKSAGNASHLIASMNYFIDLQADDYIQVIWRTPDVDITVEQFPAVAAGAGTPAIPATPSVILTANFISRLANT